MNVNFPARNGRPLYRKAHVLIALEYERTGMVPPPEWLARRIDPPVNQNHVKALYGRMVRDGELIKPYSSNQYGIPKDNDWTPPWREDRVVQLSDMLTDKEQNHG